MQTAYGADLLLAEAYTWDRAVRYHLCHADIEAHLEDFAARRVLLTLMSPQVLERLDAMTSAAASCRCD